MDFNQFKDMLFDLINESNELNVSNIAWNEKQNILVIAFADGTKFAICIKPITALKEEEFIGMTWLG